MSRAGGRDVAVAMRDCGISMTSQTRPVCKHCFSALPIDKTSSVEAQTGLLWRGFAYLATGCGIEAKDPEGLDSDRWIPHSRCCENPARAKALAGFSRHLSAGFTDLNPAPRGLSLYKWHMRYNRYFIANWNARIATEINYHNNVVKRICIIPDHCYNTSFSISPFLYENCNPCFV